MRARVMTLLLAAVMLGCQDGLSPREYSGTFVLMSINSNDLPTSQPSSISGCTSSIDDGFITLNDGVFAMTLSRTFACPGSTGVHSYDQVGGSLSSGPTFLTLRAMDPTRAGTPVTDMIAVIDNSNISLRVPEGALGFGAATQLTFKHFPGLP